MGQLRPSFELETAMWEKCWVKAAQTKAAGENNCLRESACATKKSRKGKPAIELQCWAPLSPFSSARHVLPRINIHVGVHTHTRKHTYSYTPRKDLTWHVLRLTVASLAPFAFNVSHNSSTSFGVPYPLLCASSHRILPLPFLPSCVLSILYNFKMLLSRQI